MGVGPLHTIGLAEARNRAAGFRLQRHDGVDPIERRRAERLEARLDAAKAGALEQADQEGRGTVDDALIDPSAPVMEHRIDALDGVIALDLDGAIAPAPAGEGYLPWDAPAPAPAAHTWRAVPYYAWANREIGPMRVWLPLRSRS